MFQVGFGDPSVIIPRSVLETFATSSSSNDTRVDTGACNVHVSLGSPWAHGGDFANQITLTFSNLCACSRQEAVQCCCCLL
jgi:hypothetical protein